MKRSVKLSGIVIAAVGCTGCVGCTTVNPGYVGIVVNMAGSNRGVQDYPVRTGWVWFNPFTESVFEWPVFIQTVIYTENTQEGKPVNDEITFSTGDQMKIRADVSLAYQLLPAKVPAFYVQFRTEDMEQFTHTFLKNLTREKFDGIAGRYKVEDIMGDNKKFLDEVRTELQRALDEYGIVLKQFGFANIPRPPDPVIASINAKVQATQIAIQKQNELVQVQADAQKRVAEAEGYARSLSVKAEAESAYNRKMAESMSDKLVQKWAIDKWKGDLPTYMSGQLPFIAIPK
jgi:Membrane protease subunits, stomatin/prohibitin homologs